MKITKLSDGEQDLIMLHFTKACLKYAKKNKKTFHEVLIQDVFPEEAKTEYSEYICKRIQALKYKGYINGIVELNYKAMYDEDANEIGYENDLDCTECIFDNIKINASGRKLVMRSIFKKASKEFIEASEQFIKKVASIALQESLKLIISSGIKALWVCFVA